MVNIITSVNPFAGHIISELRDAEIQQDSLRFRMNLEKLGCIFGYEIGKELEYIEKEVVTPLGIAVSKVLRDQPVLATILRAGIPFHQGFLRMFDHADSVFVSTYRKPHKDGSFTIQMEHFSVPDLDGKVLILCDTMIATGSSIIETWKNLTSRGAVRHTHIATILASSEGLENLKRNLPSRDISIWAGVIDEELTAQAFIVPGIGDTGDLAYGKKI